MSDQPQVEVLVINEDATTEIVKVNRGDLAAFQRLVGGWVENITLRPDGATMFVDEEGKFKGYKRNLLASVVVEHFIPGFSTVDFIVGKALLVGSDGEHVASVPQDIVEFVSRFQTVEPIVDGPLPYVGDGDIWIGRCPLGDYATGKQTSEAAARKPVLDHIASKHQIK